MNMSSIKQNIEDIQTRIQAACKKAERSPDEVQLLLATKTVEPARILEAFDAGCTLIGENKIQELKDKYEALAAVPHVTHFIGHLQSNKIKEAVRYADCIQSVDNSGLAQKLEERLAHENKHISILIQVNTSAEESKFGCRPEQAVELVKTIAPFEHITIKGLMTIGLFSDDTAKVRSCFRCLKQLQKEIIACGIDGVSTDVLSMGMSGDLEIAIEEGSTLVRVGSAVFGERIYADSHYWNEKK